MNQEHQKNMERHFFRASAADFKKIPGSPIAYWIGNKALRAFETGRFVGSCGSTRKGMATGLNAEFVRVWSEISISKIGFDEAPKPITTRF